MMNIKCLIDENVKLRTKNIINSGRGADMGESKAISEETRVKLRRQIALLKQQIPNDNNDMDFELHLQMVRDLESLLKRS